MLQIHFPQKSGLPNAFLPGSLLTARLLLGMDLKAVRPVDELAKIEISVMLIFGAQDDIAPLSQSHAMAAARPDTETWLVREAGHTRIYNAHLQEYVARASRFFESALR
jgi:pimeloyl-ACP methyl ester carboxylesterase